MEKYQNKNYPEDISFSNYPGLFVTNKLKWKFSKRKEIKMKMKKIYSFIKTQWWKIFRIFLIFSKFLRGLFWLFLTEFQNFHRKKRRKITNYAIGMKNYDKTWRKKQQENTHLRISNTRLVTWCTGWAAGARRGPGGRGTVVSWRHVAISWRLTLQRPPAGTAPTWLGVVRLQPTITRQIFSNEATS